jgi:hypothetical protein
VLVDHVRLVPQGALNGNPFRGMSMLDMARDSLERAGVRTRGLLAREIAQRAISHSTSDFPIIFQNVMHKTLVAAYTAVPDVWRTFCRVGTLSDFRPHYRYRPGSFGNLSTVAENGTYTYGTLPDAERESITGATKGKLLNLSRQMIINDDLGTFTDAARAMGRGAARTVEADVFTLLAANPTMGDTGALFNATVESTAGGHANLNASGAAPTVAGFDAVRQAMGAHLDVGGNDYVAARPAVWVGPLAHEGQANVVNESQYDIDQSNKTSYYPNKSRGMLRQIVGTPRLTGNIWYVFADPNEEPVIEVAFLDGEQATRPFTPNKYTRTLHTLDGRKVPVDVYCVLAAFPTGSAAIDHAVKKLLAPGARGVKSRLQDIKEAHASLGRAIELEEGQGE